MKKRTVCIILVVILLSFCIGFEIYYRAPVNFLENVSSKDVGCIAVFNGSSGARFTVSDEETMLQIIENLQGVTAKRNGISPNHDGYAYQLTFMDEQGKTIDTLIVNSANTVRKDPFFYEITDGTLCYGLLQTLESIHGQSGDSGLHSGYLEDGSRWFEGTVKSVNGNSIQITPCADTWEYQSGGAAGIIVTLRLSDGTTAPVPQKGDQVRITYDGMIAESYPPQILHVYAMENLE